MPSLALPYLFRGAYAALAYVAQQPVSAYGWLESDEMIRRLALAEMTPGR
jgi:chromate transporter